MSYRQRIGFGFFPGNARESVAKIVRAEAAGIETAWLVMPALGRDTLTMHAAAATQTTRIKLGTAIVPAFTRHPNAMATQLLTLAELAPGRLRIGIGTAHQRSMIPGYGADFGKPLSQLREYLQMLVPAVQQGQITFEGDFYKGDAKFEFASQAEILISTLREKAFELAGEMTDGAITWLCPLDYVQRTGKPALIRGAEKAGRTTPPLVMHTLVSTRTDIASVRDAARPNLKAYASNVFYRRMFEDAGFPMDPDTLEIPDALIDALVVSGTPEEIAAGLQHRLDHGADELVVSFVATHDTPADEAALFQILGNM